MNPAIETMLAPYRCVSLEDYENALKEILQEIALLGLWRAKFFEHAAFYGGTALRVAHQLDRFSEDLDFSLLKPNAKFSLAAYTSAIVTELAGFDFDVTFERKAKTAKSTIESAFIKANTALHLLKVRADLKTHKDSLLKIKLEIDTDPPSGFETEVFQHFQPIPFSFRIFKLPDLFAGKLHALLCRARGTNVKGRDWYDFLWYITRNTPVNLRHLVARMRQTGHLKPGKQLNLTALRQLLSDRIEMLDIARVKRDVEPFIKQPSNLAAWSKPLFLAAVQRLTAT